VPLSDGLGAATGINDSQEIVGYKSSNRTPETAFFYQAFTDDITFFSEGATCPTGLPCATHLTGINNNGDFVGYVTQPNAQRQSFVDVGGVLTLVPVPSSAQGAYLNWIENTSSRAVGSYVDSSAFHHGFLYNVMSTGSITNRDYPGAAQTKLFGINQRAIVVGCYFDSTAASHGIVYAQGNWITYDYPGATGTCLDGINDHGMISAQYFQGDPGHVGGHGLILQLSGQ
jgi:hypothetical protein